MAYVAIIEVSCLTPTIVRNIEFTMLVLGRCELNHGCRLAPIGSQSFRKIGWPPTRVSITLSRSSCCSYPPRRTRCMPCCSVPCMFEQGTSTVGSEDSFTAGRRDRVGTKAEKELTKLFERWLHSTTSVLRAAIFGDDMVRSALGLIRSYEPSPQG